MNKIFDMPKINYIKFNLRLVRNVLALAIIISISFGIGYLSGFKGFKAEVKFTDVKIAREVPEDKNVNLDLFWKVWDTLGVKYYDKSKLIPSEMVYGAIRGMVSAVGDPYTVFLPPQEKKVVQEDLQGTFEGVGIQIGFKGTRLAVIAPLPGTPAEKSGVKAGDLILVIRDESRRIDQGTDGISITDAVEAIRGPAGTTVTLTLLRDGKDEPFDVDITRQSINVPSIVLEYKGDNNSIAYIKVLKFSAETSGEWEEAVIELVKRNDLKGIIIDLRNNPGGYLEKAVELASDFLENKDTVVVEEGAGGVKNEYKVEKIGRLRKVNLVILINEGSASASEIMAGALRDHDRAKLVGSTTFGKGTIQEPMDVDGGAGLHITIAKWLTPSGFWVNEGGLKPDVEIEDKEDTEEDEQLQKAVELLGP